MNSGAKIKIGNTTKFKMYNNLKLEEALELVETCKKRYIDNHKD